MPFGRFAKRKSPADDGAAAVEFALVLTPLVLIVFGIITFGIIFAQQLALGNAARQGARFGAVADRTCQDIYNETANNAVALAMPKTSVVIAVTRGPNPTTTTFTCAGPDPAAKPCAGSSPGDSVQVEARFTTDPLLPIPFVSSGPVDLKANGNFRCEFS